MMQTRSLNEPFFSEVYETLYPVLFRIAYRITGNQPQAEDLCHEAFIKYYERSRPLPDLDQTKYWLIRVVRNISLNHEKRKLRERKAVQKLKEDYSPFAESGEQALLREETISAVQQALNKLPYNLRIALTLKEYGSLNYNEIGSILGIREGNVKVRVFRARERLARILEEDDNHVS